MRDPLFAEDETTMEETLKHALERYEGYKEEKYDIGVFLTPTDIFRKVAWIRKAVTLLKENENIESSASLTNKTLSKMGFTLSNCLYRGWS